MRSPLSSCVSARPYPRAVVALSTSSWAHAPYLEGHQIEAPQSGILGVLHERTFELKDEHGPMAGFYSEWLGQERGPIAFAYSLSIIVCLALAYLGVNRGNAHRQFLSKQAKKELIASSRYWKALAWYSASLVTLFVGIWVFGQFSAAVVLSDLTFFLFSVGLLVGLAVLALVVGGRLSGNMGKFGFLLLGLWQGLLQVGVPFYVAKFASPSALVPLAISVLVFMWFGARLAAENRRWLLVVVFVVYGGLQFCWPTLLPSSSPDLDIWQLLCATILGAVMSCVWFGWYLAVALAFNGRNNEVGGAARIEEFKQFIRFKLSENELTDYVIGFDKPAVDGKDLKVEIIDCFTLRCP